MRLHRRVDGLPRLLRKVATPDGAGTSTRSSALEVAPHHHVVRDVFMTDAVPSGLVTDRLTVTSSERQASVARFGS